MCEREREREKRSYISMAAPPISERRMTGRARPANIRYAFSTPVLVEAVCIWPRNTNRDGGRERPGGGGGE